MDEDDEDDDDDDDEDNDDNGDDDDEAYDNVWYWKIKCSFWINFN